MPTPKWAKETGAPIVITGANSISNGAEELGKMEPQVLPSSILAMKRLKDGNAASPSPSVIQTLDFHPYKENILLTGGLDKTLKIFEAYDKKNNLMKSIFLADLPISMAKFTADGKNVVITGRRPYYYSYDIEADKVLKISGLMGLSRKSNRTVSASTGTEREEKSLERFFVSPKNDYIAFTGNQGYIHLVGRSSQQFITSLRMNDPVRWLDFLADGNSLFAIGESHEIYQWDLRKSFECVARVVDVGSMKGSTIAASPCGSLLACGSGTGIVSLYATSDMTSTSSFESIRALKTVDNLTTHINNLHFSHDSQLLAMTSRSVKNGLRFLHIPSMTVFSNGPMMSNLGYVNALALSRKSKFVATGNDKGVVQLFKLEHYAKL